MSWPYGLLGLDLEDLVEGAADRDHPQILVQDDQGLPDWC
jgi:hypothetical protein